MVSTEKGNVGKKQDVMMTHERTNEQRTYARTCSRAPPQHGWNLLSRKYQQWKEQADKDEADAADDESDSGIGSDDGQVAA
jgi:hypothetical protein